jgi:hypothetical protein
VEQANATEGMGMSAGMEPDGKIHMTQILGNL